MAHFPMGSDTRKVGMMIQRERAHISSPETAVVATAVGKGWSRAMSSKR